MNSNYITYKEGLEIAKNAGLEDEYNACIADDFTPYEALTECDIL